MKFFVCVAFCLVAVCSASLFRNEVTKQGDDMTEFNEEHDASIFRAYSNRENDIHDIHLRFYNGRAVDKFVDIKLPEASKLLSTEGFDKNEPTVFYIHGYKETPDSDSVHTVVSAYFRAQPKTNVVLVDWSNMAFGSYIINAAPNTKKVGHAVAEQLKKLFDMGMSVESFHLVGHSLGGQTAGFVGQSIKKLGVTLERITGLDPAFPMFYPGLVLGKISKNDAKYVDIIHTSPGQYGAPVVTGQADFWPNKGKMIQPGCPTGIHITMTPEDLCSHWRSWVYWAESIENPTAFPVVSGDGRTVYMGIRARESGAQGEYVLATNERTPFGKGKQ